MTGLLAQWFREGTQAFRSALGSDIALRGSQHFEANHVLADRCRAQQRGIEVRMEMALWMVDAIGGRLMESHRIGEGNAENLVVGGGNPVKHLA